MLQRLVDKREKLHKVYGLLDEIEGALFHGKDRVLHVPVSRHQNDRQLFGKLFHQLHAVKFRHLPVGQEQVGLFRLRQIFGFLSVAGFQHFVALVGESFRKRFPRDRVVLGDQYL